MNITIKYYDYPIRMNLDAVDLRHKREELEKRYMRIEAFRACTFHTLDKDERLPEYIMDAIDAADMRLCRMSDYCEEAIESIDEVLRAIETLENNLPFIYDEAETVLKKGAQS